LGNSVVVFDFVGSGLPLPGVTHAYLRLIGFFILHFVVGVVSVVVGIAVL
jgi:hypothetical protein